MSNFYKHSPLPKWVNSQVRKRNNMAPKQAQVYSYKRQESINILDIYRLQAKQQKDLADPSVAKWRGGDMDDRREFMK